MGLDIGEKIQYYKSDMDMLKDITLGQYVPGDSIIHRMDPRIKIFLTFILAIGFFVLQSPFSLGLLTLFLLVVTLLSQIPAGYVLRGLKPVAMLVLVVVFFNIFFSKGEILWEHTVYFFTITVTKEGLITAGLMASRLILLVLSTSLLTLTTSPISLTDAIENLLSPFNRIGIPSHEIAMMMTIALRFIPVLIEETDKILKAQRSRGAVFGKGNIFTMAKSLLPVLVPLFVYAFKHAEDLAIAMESRCYRGGVGRTRLKELKIQYMDLVSVILSGIIVGVSVFLEIYSSRL